MNNLQYESSPYLLQHKDNPVEWHIWSASTLALAGQLNKPILVSLGYSTCHWCHVMAHESFEDVQTAKLMNEYFVNVKIDREERPDLDHYFMNAVQAMGISGGWPLHCFLTSDGKPFFGGTYFPPSPRYGRSSWRQIIQSIHQAYQTKSLEIKEQAQQLYNHLKYINEVHPVGLSDNHDVNLQAIYEKLQDSMDFAHGGFGSSPKFPNCQGIQLLFHLYFLSGNNEAVHHALFSLKQMCQGGIYDQLDGGFCRYSVDGDWDVPHFEKMLYDHAQLIQTLSIAYRYNNSAFTKKIIEQSLEFFEKTMQDECGLFYAALNADSEGEEGSYYVWKEEELKDVLQEDYNVFKDWFELNSLDHLHTDLKVLRIKKSISDDGMLEKYVHSTDLILNKLKKSRSERILPSIDRKMIVCWNAMMVSAYLSWYQTTCDQIYLVKAKKLMNDLLKYTSTGEIELCRYYINGQTHGYGFLEDYSFVIKGLLDLYFVTQDDHYMHKSMQFFEYLHLKFKDPDAVFYNLASSRHVDFDIRQQDWAETTYPNPNALLSWSCRYFYEYTQDTKYEEISNALLNSIQERAVNHPLSLASWVQQLLYRALGPIILKTSPDVSTINTLSKLYIPGLIRLASDEDLSGLVLCFDGICHRPVRTIEEIVPLFSKYKIQFENQD